VSGAGIEPAKITAQDLRQQTSRFRQPHRSNRFRQLRFPGQTVLQLELQRHREKWAERENTKWDTTESKSIFKLGAAVIEEKTFTRGLYIIHWHQQERGRGWERGRGRKWG
jgi:hypothetical protein